MWLELPAFDALVLVAQEAQGGALGFLQSGIFPMIVIGIMAYFLLLRPEQRKRAEMSRMLDNLKKNDHVITIGGIHGVVVGFQSGKEDEVTLRVDDGNNTRLRVLRSSISRVLKDEADESKDS